MSNSKINVNARLFRAAYNCVSTEQTRYYLNGVFIEKHPTEGVLLVATDGHRLIVVHDASGSIEGASQIVKLDKTALGICKAGRGEAGDRRLVIDGTNATIENFAGQPVGAAYGVIIDGTFPDWSRVAKPSFDETAPAFYKPKYLKAFGDAADELAERKGVAISLAGSSDGPALVRFSGVSIAYGVIMPVRGDSDALEIPTFMNTAFNPPATASIAA